MFIIDFRNRNMSEYRFSVMNNSNVDVVNFYSRFTQYASDTSIYLKIRSHNDDYVDKIAIASANVSVDADALVVKWTMGAVSTHCKKIYLQLQFEKEGDIIDQTPIVSLTLADTIDVEELIPPLYPQFLKHLQEEVEKLQAESYALSTMSFSGDTLSLIFKNKANQTLTSLQVSIPLSERLKVIGYGEETTVAEMYTASQGRLFITPYNQICQLSQSNNSYSLSVWAKGWYGNGSNIAGEYSFDSYINDTIDHNWYVTSENVDEYIGGKVDKISSQSKVYGTDASGNQTALDVDNGTGYGGKVARRDSNNQLHIPQTPTENTHATSKYYVDTIIANIKKDSYKEVDTTEYPTLNDFLASTGEEGYLYLYPIDTTDLTKGYYRYVWEGNAWLDLGTTQIDLSNYYTKSETNTLLGAKANQNDLTTHTGNTNNPHNVTKAQVGLDNVDNTSDANKPVSTAQQQALNGKQNDVCLSIVDGKLCITYEA